MSYFTLISHGYDEEREKELGIPGKKGVFIVVMCVCVCACLHVGKAEGAIRQQRTNYRLSASSRGIIAKNAHLHTNTFWKIVTHLSGFDTVDRVTDLCVTWPTPHLPLFAQLKPVASHYAKSLRPFYLCIPKSNQSYNSILS